MIRLVTGFTAGYPWGEPYLESLDRHLNANIKRHLFTHDVPNRSLLNPKRVSKVLPLPENRCGSLQHGEFLKHLYPEAMANYDLIIFTDADMLMQRAFTQDEIHELGFLQQGQVKLGYNGGHGWKLADEAQLLDQQCEDWVIDAMFPGWRELPGWNCGVIVARAATYRDLYHMARALLPVAESCFAHYAVIQFVICYCVGKWMRHLLLPQSIHVHGHFGLPKNAEWDDAGNVLVTDETGVKEMSVFRHALNLTPSKGERPVNHQHTKDTKALMPRGHR